MLSFIFNYISFKERGYIQLLLDIFYFNSLLDSILSESFVKKAWKDVKKDLEKK